MEQTSLPIKTKITAWWMKILGVVIMVFVLVYGVLGFLFADDCNHHGRGLLIFFMIVLGIPIFLGGLFVFYLGNSILKRERSAWWVSVILFLIGIICGIGGSIFYFLKECYIRNVNVYECVSYSFAAYGDNILAGTVFLLLFLVPLIILFLDRKNFWKIAT